MMYYMTGKTVENLTDIDMFLFVERGKRGGICTTGADRYFRANHKYLKNYNPDEPSSYVLYIDANALYPTTMCKPLPYGGFKWEQEGAFTEDFIRSIPEEGVAVGDKRRGYIFEIDGYFPKEVHDICNDYIPLPENKAHEPSPYMKNVASEINIKSNKQVKLVCALTPKTNYVVHYAELQSALKRGFRITKVNKVLGFDQSCWMKPFIMANQTKRMAAKNKAEKDLYKLFNNSTYGKTMENVRNRREIKLTTDDKKKQKYANSPWFKNFTGYDNGLYAIEMLKKKVIMNKPIYIGVAVLAWSKAHMFDAYYDVIKPKYGDNVHMHYTDTDSMFLSIRTEDLYRDMAQDLDFLKIFDLGTYKDNHPIFSFGNKEALQDLIKKNKDVLGMFKDEAEGNYITEMCFLRAKMYTFSKEGVDKPIMKAKGVKKSAMKQLMKVMYKDCLL